MPPRDILNLYKQHAGDRWPLFAAQAWVESRFDPYARSFAGAVGVAQFMPKTWDWAIVMGWVPKGASPHDVEASVKAQIAYMDWILARTDNNLRDALAAYNWGIGNVRKAQRKHGKRWIAHAPRETHAYVLQIVSLKEWIKAWA